MMDEKTRRIVRDSILRALVAFALCFCLGFLASCRMKDYTDPEEELYFFEVSQVATIDSQRSPILQPEYPIKDGRAVIDVVVLFVVDTSGKADMTTARVLNAVPLEFENSVLDFLRVAWFKPAIGYGGNEVKERGDQVPVFVEWVTHQDA